MLFKIMTGIVVTAGIALASQHAQGMPLYLLGKHGKKSLYVQADANSLTLADKAVAEKARTRNPNARHAGDVFFFQGNTAAANRYVSTGRIIVRFDSGGKINPQAFARANGLIYLHRIGHNGSSAVFINKSDSDDVTQSSKLVKENCVVSATPDWILPVKLF